MKVLWVTNNPCSSIEREGGRTIAGGWLSSLEKAVKGDITLEIAFLSSGQKQEEFTHEGVKYYSIAPYNSRNYFVFRLKRLLMPWSGQDRHILKRLESIIRLSRPDLVHIHGTEKCFGLISEKMGGEGGYVSYDGRKIPVAISIQGIMGPYLRKFFSGIPRKDVRRYESIGCKLHKKSAFRMYRQMQHQAANETAILGKAGFIFGRTAWDMDETGRANPERRYFTVGEIMRTPFYCPGKFIGHSSYDRPVEHTRILLTSTVSEGIYKGYELLLKTAAALVGKGVSFCWTVIGYSPDNEMVSLSEKSTGLKSSELNIRLAGRMDAACMVKELAATDIYCQVSHIENSPNSLCEAMLLGLPCIATNVGGTSSLIENWKTGLLVSDTDPDEFAEAIISLAADGKRMAEMGDRAMAAAKERHDPQKVKSQLLHAYGEITGCRESASEGNSKQIRQ